MNSSAGSLNVILPVTETIHRPVQIAPDLIQEHSGRIVGLRPDRSGGVSNAPRNLGAVLTLDNRDVVLALQIKPELRTVSEVTAEPHGCVGGNRTPAIQNVGDAARRDAKIQRQPVCADL